MVGRACVLSYAVEMVWGRSKSSCEREPNQISMQKEQGTKISSLNTDQIHVLLQSGGEGCFVVQCSVVH